MTGRYHCLIHPRRHLRFDDDHWICPAGHETLLAWDSEAEEAVELREHGLQFGAYPV